MLWVNLGKTNWAKNLILVLGRRLPSACVKTNPHKVLAVQSMPPPTNIMEVKRFMGMRVFYLQFIPDFSTIEEPLFRLCHDKVLFVWGLKQQKVFEMLKEALTKAPVLQFPKCDQLFYIKTNVS